MNAQTNSDKDVRRFIEKLLGCYQLSFREKLPGLVSTIPIGIFSVGVSALILWQYPPSTFYTLCAIAAFIFALFMATLALAFWNGRCIIEKDLVAFSAFPPIFNWQINIEQIESIKLLESDGIYHLQFYTRDSKHAKTFLFSGKNLQERINQLIDKQSKS